MNAAQKTAGRTIWFGPLCVRELFVYDPDMADW